MRADEDDEAWRISVTDTGPGLPPRARENLFKAFQGGATKGGSRPRPRHRGRDRAGPRRPAGAGAHGPAGTEFAIRLPKGAALAPPRPEEPADAGPGRPRHPGRAIGAAAE